jgi:peptide chain release factor subunit 1
MMEDGKSEKKITIDLEPFKPITTFSYKCQNSFHTEPLEALLEDDERFGFIIVDGNGVLYATLQGNVKEVLQRVSVTLPKKHGRGGQSAARFARLREEKRHTYVMQVCERATQHFITDNKPNVKGIIVAGSAQLKVNVVESDHFDKRLLAVVLQVVDVSYG